MHWTPAETTHGRAAAAKLGGAEGKEKACVECAALFAAVVCQRSLISAWCMKA